MRTTSTTSTTSTPPRATIEAQEAESVASLLALTRAVDAIGAPRSLLYAHVPFAAYQGETRSIGAPSATVARDTYTRHARRAQRQRQIARRAAGPARFLSSLA